LQTFILGKIVANFENQSPKPLIQNKIS